MLRAQDFANQGVISQGLNLAEFTSYGSALNLRIIVVLRKLGTYSHPSLRHPAARTTAVVVRGAKMVTSYAKLFWVLLTEPRRCPKFLSITAMLCPEAMPPSLQHSPEISPSKSFGKLSSVCRWATLPPHVYVMPKYPFDLTVQMSLLYAIPPSAVSFLDRGTTDSSTHSIYFLC